MASLALKKRNRSRTEKREKWGLRQFLTIFILKNVGLMNQAPTEESIPREMGPVPIFQPQKRHRTARMILCLKSYL